MADVMTEKGYVRTSVQDVLQRAGVSRRAFYEQFDSKLDCFMAAFDGARDMLLGRMMAGASMADCAGEDTGIGGSPADDRLTRFEAAVCAYLDAIVEDLPSARLLLVECFAAGPEAIARKNAIRERATDSMAMVLGVTGPAGRLTCTVVVAATSSMVTALVAEGDPDGVLALGPALNAHVRRLWHMGAFSEPAA
jgi:AcrR family transcriptional regulator